MNLHVSIAPIASLVAGILILVVPRLLNYIVAVYLILIGLLGLSLGLRLSRQSPRRARKERRRPVQSCVRRNGPAHGMEAQATCICSRLR
jgi:hypothetical protein